VVGEAAERRLLSAPFKGSRGCGELVAHEDARSGVAQRDAAREGFSGEPGVRSWRVLRGHHD